MRRILLCVVLWAGAAAAAPPAPPVILVMGDSLSAAFNLKPSEGWVALLDSRLKQGGYDYTVVNASISGETTSGGLARLPETLGQHRPTIVILELGANDGLRGTPIKAMRDNLERMIRLSRQAGAKVLLTGILLPPNYGKAYAGEFDAVYAGLAMKYRLAFLPFLLEGVAEHRERLQPDGMHPLAEAEPRVLDNVWAKLEPMLQKQASQK